MQGGTTTGRHGVTRNRNTKILKHTENVFKIEPGYGFKLKTIPKTRTTDPSDRFLHLNETSLDTRWEFEHFRLFFFFSGCWFSRLVLRIYELFECPKY